MKVTLTVTDGPHKGQSYVFREHDTFIVGRSKDAHFRLPIKDKTISRFHFMVEVNPPSCRILDMASTNGVKVNGRNVASADLKDGDVILGGRTTFVLEMAHEERSWDSKVDLLASDSIPTRDHMPALLYEPVKPEAVAPFSMTKYRIIRELGRGGMGIVQLAEMGEEATPVAIKTLTPAVVGSEAVLARFFREASILRKLDHPNVVKFYEIGQANGQFFFVMEYVPGVDSAELLKTQGPLPIGRAVAMACQILDGLAYAHALGYVHRDIKPNNLLVSPLEGRDVVKLADFGLARTYQTSPMSGLTLAGQFGGTAGFLAPEQITNFRDSKPSSDIYALAATLYNLLTGARPYNLPANVESQLLIILQEDPIPIRDRRPEIPEGLADVIHQAMRRDPVDRFADALAMKMALSRFRNVP